MVTKKPRITLKDCLEYECQTHWLASYIGFKWGQDLMATYMSWKVQRKYKKYCWMMDMRERVAAIESPKSQ